MQGYQLTFFTTQQHVHGFSTLADWLMKFAKDNGAIGGTLFGAAEGFDHQGRMHSSHFFEMADQPLAVTVSVDGPACERLLNALANEDVNLTYVKVPVEFGRVGKASK